MVFERPRRSSTVSRVWNSCQADQGACFNEGSILSGSTHIMLFVELKNFCFYMSCKERRAVLHLPIVALLNLQIFNHFWFTTDVLIFLSLNSGGDLVDLRARLMNPLLHFLGWILAFECTSIFLRIGHFLRLQIAKRIGLQCATHGCVFDGRQGNTSVYCDWCFVAWVKQLNLLKCWHGDKLFISISCLALHSSSIWMCLINVSAKFLIM